MATAGRSIRHAVVKQQPKTRKRSAANVPLFHAHGCTSCGLRYTDRCDDGGVNGICMTCEHGHARTKWQTDGDPVDCCRAHSKPVNDLETLTRHALGGDAQWYQCQGPHGCSRTHPYDPTKEIA